MSSQTLALLLLLIQQPSITPNDGNCQAIITKRLQHLGFHLESMDANNVKNLYARKGTTGPCLLFAGHTDVVPPGPLDEWTSPPFEPTIRNGALYGRGAADMKSGLAAMICACEIFLVRYPQHRGSIAFLITSDEEGQAIHGTQHVVTELLKRKEQITWAVIGEATSEKTFGDVVKVGRRGSLNGKITIYGKQGHIAYPQKADNPIPKSMLALHELANTKWDTGNEFFPATQFQISNLVAGTGANNVIPGHLEVVFNFRFSNEVTADQLKNHVHAILDKHHLDYQIQWHLSGEPFLSKLGTLFHSTQQAIEKVAGIRPVASTSGGTSDGRFITKLGCELIEIGPINQSIHQIDEHINIQELDLLTQVYLEIMIKLLVE